MNKYAQMADRLYDLNEQLERLEKENAELKEVHESDKRSLRLIAGKGAELEKELKAEKEFNATLRKEIDEYTNSHTLCAKYKELEKEISILLSCKNCPNNKGGYICQKEYEDKCLSQKTQYIKELKEENAELKAGRGINVFTKQLTKAKELIRQLCSMVRELNKPNIQLTNVDYSLSEAEQFLKETVVDS